MNVNEMTMKELVAEYNEISETTVKRFSDRKTAERRLMIAKLDAEMIEHFGVTHCPHCGVHLENGVGWNDDGMTKCDTNEYVCLGCGEEFGPELKAKSESLSEAIRKSWQDPTTAAKRSQRSAVKVGNDYYTSVAAAFRALHLPMNEHIKFRMNLKAAETLTAYGKNWEIQPLD